MIQGWLDYTSTPDSTKQSQMLTALNMLIKRIGTESIKLWCYENVTIPTLTQGKANYSIGPTGDVVADRPLRIWGANLNYLTGSNPSSPPMLPMSDKEYQELSNKTTQGAPVNYYYDAQLTNGVVYFYPTPDSYSAANCNVTLRIRRQILDLATVNDNMDFPSEWYEPICYQLADTTALENQTPMDVCDRIAAKAFTLLDEVNNFDTEYASLYFQYDRWGGR